MEVPDGACQGRIWPGDCDTFWFRMVWISVVFTQAAAEHSGYAIQTTVVGGRLDVRDVLSGPARLEACLGMRS